MEDAPSRELRMRALGEAGRRTRREQGTIMLFVTVISKQKHSNPAERIAIRALRGSAVLNGIANEAISI
jgi:hypothetical protein